MKRAYASGVLTIETKYGRVTYQSMTALYAAIQREEGAISAASGTATNRSVVRFRPSGGYGRSWENW